MRVFIPRKHQSAPKSPLPKDFEWKYHEEKVPRPLAPTLIDTVCYITGAKDGWMLTAKFTISEWKGEGYKEYISRMDHAVRGICHDILVMIAGGSASAAVGDKRGTQTHMLEKVAQKASQKFDVDPGKLMQALTQ